MNDGIQSVTLCHNGNYQSLVYAGYKCVEGKNIK
jgi:hypothetical protein